jgi:[ribosomal protein S18]-alanine N-acetyltransferase
VLKGHLKMTWNRFYQYIIEIVEVMNIISEKPIFKELQKVRIVSLSDIDIEQVKEIEEESNLETWSTADYQKEIQRDDSITMVAKSESHVVGFLISRLIKIDELIYESEIYNIAVRKDLLHMGIGQRLFNQYISRMGLEFGVVSVWLEVRKTNFKAIKFYKKNGFEKTGERKDFYCFPVEDALIMRFCFEV